MAGRPLPALLIKRLQNITKAKVVSAFSSDTPNVADVILEDGTQLQVNLATNQVVTEQNKQGARGHFENLITRKSQAVAEEKARSNKGDLTVTRSDQQPPQKAEEKPIEKKASTKVTKTRTLKKKAK